MRIWDFENNRNTENGELFKAIITEAYGADEVCPAHHLIYVKIEKREGYPDSRHMDELPSADTLIFDHKVAKKIWGEENYRDVLARLALEPTDTRDKLLGDLYYARPRRT